MSRVCASNDVPPLARLFLRENRACHVALLITSEIENLLTKYNQSVVNQSDKVHHKNGEFKLNHLIFTSSGLRGQCSLNG